MNKILDKLAYGPTLFLGFVFFLMPFFPAPHFVDKILMIRDGITFHPIDIFDLTLHSLAGLTALLKFLRYRKLSAMGQVGEGDRDAAPLDMPDHHTDQKG